MNIVYRGDDGHVQSLGETSELRHWKYIKKIGNRYFYTTEALEAYYRDQKKVADAEYVKDTYKSQYERQKRDAQQSREYKQSVRNVKDPNRSWVTVTSDNEGNYKSHKTTRAERQQILKDYQKDYKKKQRMNRFLDKTQDRYLSARRVVKPVAKTAKRAVTPVESPEQRIYKRRKKAEKYINRWLEQ